MALLIKAQKKMFQPIRTRVIKSITGKDEFTLTELQSLVSGNIEIVPIRCSLVGREITDEKGDIYTITEKTVMLVNEEGLIHKLSFNIFASNLADKAIVGDVVLVERDKEFV